MPRYRLRFLLQEFDLVGPEVVIGRSPECHITIEDPLISRRHARLAVGEQGAVLQDLGSHNGVRVNGRLIHGEHLLREGDRIRIGTQEFVFAVVHREQRAVRPTGYMRVCRACSTPYPEGSPECPHCGAPVTPDEDTMSGVIQEPKRNWAFQLLGEVIERALVAGKASDAERLMRRAAREVDERLAAGERLDPAHIGMVAQFAVRLARLVDGAEWIAWVLGLHRRQGMMLSDDVIDRLEEIDLHAMADVQKSLDAYVAWFRTHVGSSASGPDLARLERLEQMRR